MKAFSLTFAISMGAGRLRALPFGPGPLAQANAAPKGHCEFGSYDALTHLHLYHEPVIPVTFPLDIRPEIPGCV